jgi:hypothetical protein
MDSRKSFTGSSSAECSLFIAAIYEEAFEKGKLDDPRWIANFASISFTGKARRWWENLGRDTQQDWRKLEQALSTAAWDSGPTPYPGRSPNLLPTPLPGHALVKKRSQTFSGTSSLPKSPWERLIELIEDSGKLKPQPGGELKLEWLVRHFDDRVDLYVDEFILAADGERIRCFGVGDTAAEARDNAALDALKHLDAQI